MLTTIDISKTELNWAELFRQAKEKGLRYLITNGDQEMFEVSLAKSTEPEKRILSLHPGAMVMSDDFDDPLPDSFWLGDDDDQEDGTLKNSEMTDLEYLRTLVGTFSSGTSDTSQNVKAIVSEMILKKHERR